MKKSTVNLIVLVFIIFLIILFGSIFLNRKVNATFTIRPDGKYKLVANKKEYEITNNKTISLNTGKQKVVIKAEGYEDFILEVNIKGFGDNNYLVDMTNNRIAPNSLADISGISSNILKKYKLRSLTIYENGTWLAATLISKTNPNDFVAFAAKRENKKWSIAIAPAIEFNQSDLNNTPKDISEYLNTFSLNFIGEPEEDGGV